MSSDAPALDELGFKNFDAGTSQGVWAPVGPPAAIVDRMNRDINRALMLPSAVDPFVASVLSSRPVRVGLSKSSTNERSFTIEGQLGCWVLAQDQKCAGNTHSRPAVMITYRLNFPMAM